MRSYATSSGLIDVYKRQGLYDIVVWKNRIILIPNVAHFGPVSLILAHL